MDDSKVGRWQSGRPFMWLCRDCPAATAVVVCTACGLTYAVWLLGPAVAFGTSVFWQLPTLGSGTLDLRNALAGYWWFANDAWRWPLLALPNAAWPHGSNAELFDICPAAAIVGKVLSTIFGRSVNPYPWWVIGCFAANAAALGALVRALGNRSLLGAIVAGGFGAMAPVIQQRLSLGHMSLLAHWVPILALALYFKISSHRFDARAITGLTGLAALATCVHLYIYVMTAAIGAAAVLQALIDRRASIVQGLLTITLLLLAGIVPLWVFGLFAGGDLLDTQGYGYGIFSMNLVSLFWPQTSGLFHWTGIYWLTRGSIGATRGQYDGFDYIGGGAIFLLAIAIWQNFRKIPSITRQHIGLAVVLVLLILWALSNRVYFGPYLIVSYQVPHLLLTTVLGWFRSSGRFIWPVGWLLVGGAIALGLASVRQASAIVMVGLIALVLQWTDVAPWRAMFAQLLSEAPASAFGTPDADAEVAQAIKAAGAVSVIPPVFCSSAGGDYDSPFNTLALEVELMAAHANARMPDVYLSRHIRCDSSIDLTTPSVVILPKDAGFASLRRTLPASIGCKDYPIAQVCLVARSRAD